MADQDKHEAAQASKIWEEVIELDKLTIRVLVDNETDSLSTPCSCCNSKEIDDRLCSYVPEIVTNVKQNHGEFNISSMCFAGHGLSVLLQAESQGQSHTLLFDAGPSDFLWRTNAERLSVARDTIEAAVLSHWHADHSAGLTAVVACNKNLLRDLHPDKPLQRGITHGEKVTPIQKDPSWSDLEHNGSVIQRHADAHTLLDGFFFVSGSIPRVTSYEQGMASHVRLQEDGSWRADPLITEERYLAVKMKGLGAVVLSGCSHAGVVNVMKEVQRATGDSPAVVMGGLHLSTSDCEDRIEATVADIVDMRPQLVVGGHCTGWRAKAALANAMAGRFMPCSVGSTFQFSST